jgi:hypothetical protein
MISRSERPFNTALAACKSLSRAPDDRSQAAELELWPEAGEITWIRFWQIKVSIAALGNSVSC